MSTSSSIEQTATIGLFSSFVPESLFSDESQTKEALSTCKLAITISRNALRALQNGTLSSFDALVSDRACHVRALVVSQIAQEETLYNENLDSMLRNCAQQVQSLLNKNIQHKKLSDLITEKALSQPEINARILFLSQAFLLNKVKSFHPAQNTCQHCNKAAPTILEKTEAGKLLGLQKNISIKTLQDMVEATKINFSKECVFLFQKLTCDASRTIPKGNLELFLDDKFIKVIKDKTEIAVFPAMEALLKISAHTGTPILLKSQPSEHTPENPKHTFDITILGKASHNGLHIAVTPIESATLSKKQPVIVIEGQRCTGFENPPTKNEILHIMQTRFGELILANSACHPQFSDGSSLSDIDNLIIGMKKMGLEEGFSEENQRIFAIKHIFASTLGQEIAASSSLNTKEI